MLCFPAIAASSVTATSLPAPNCRIQRYSGDARLLPRAACATRNLVMVAARRRGVRIARLKPAAQPELAGLEFQRAVFIGFQCLVVVARQRVHRERIAIEVILQI